MAIRLWFPLNTDVINNQGLDEVSIQNNNIILSDTGILGKSYQFTNNSSLVVNNIGDIFNKDISEFSICAWVKLVDGYSSNCGCHLISISNNLRICISKNNAAIAFIANNANVMVGSDMRSNKLETNKWYHFAVTLKDGIINYYINGEKDSSSDIGLKTLSGTKNTNSISIGVYNNEQPCACINDYRFYDNVISIHEIKQLSKALVCHYPMNNIDGKYIGRNLLVGTNNGSVKWSNSHYDGVYSCEAIEWLGVNAVKMSCSQKATSWKMFTFDGLLQNFSKLEPSTNYILSYDTNGIVPFSSLWDSSAINSIVQSSPSSYIETSFGRHYTVKILTKPELIKKNQVVYFQNNLSKNESVIIANLKLEKGEKDTRWLPAVEDNSQLYSEQELIDVSGCNYNASTYITHIMPSQKNSPHGDNSFIFNNDYLSLKNPLSSENMNFSISCWIKLNSIDKNHTIFCSRKSIGKGISVFIVNNLIRFDDGIQTYFSYKLSLGEWFHMCIVKNNADSSKSLYINGQLTDKQYESGDLSDIGVNAVIGGSESSDNGIATDNYLDGRMTDFRLYNTALSSDDINALYNTPISILRNGRLFTKGEFIEYDN